MTERSYTPDEANAALPLVSAIVADLVHLDRLIDDAARAYAELKADTRKPQTALNQARRALGDLVASRDECETELEELGVRLGDAALGICDFPSDLDGRPVYLCWGLGEQSVEFYHARDAGFADRCPLPVPVAAG